MSYKYVTPYWKDSQTIYEDNIEIYTGTTFYILNYGNNPANMNIHFFDQTGNLIPEMEVGMILPRKHFLDLRIVDIIAQYDPGYRNQSGNRSGSLRIVCDEKLAISGKMYNGKRNHLGTEDLNVWSIPFEEVQLDDVLLQRIDPNQPIPLPDNPFGKYRPRWPK